MSMERIEQLARIYNTLLLVNTKGEDTVLMADCLKALRTFVTEEQQNLTLKEEE